MWQKDFSSMMWLSKIKIQLVFFLVNSFNWIINKLQIKLAGNRKPQARPRYKTLSNKISPFQILRRDVAPIAGADAASRRRRRRGVGRGSGCVAAGQADWHGRCAGQRRRRRQGQRHVLDLDERAAVWQGEDRPVGGGQRRGRGGEAGGQVRTVRVVGRAVRGATGGHFAHRQAPHPVHVVCLAGVDGDGGVVGRWRRRGRQWGARRRRGGGRRRIALQRREGLVVFWNLACNKNHFHGENWFYMTPKI